MLTKKEKLKKIVKRLMQFFFHRDGRDSTALFIFGSQRSGTNMLIDILNRSWQTECYRESDDEAFHHVVLKRNDIIESLISKSNSQKTVFKSISDSQNAKDLLDHFSKSKAIWIFRQHSDVVNSALRNFKEHRRELQMIIENPQQAGWRAENIAPENIKIIKRFMDKDISEASSRALMWYLRNYQLFQQKLELHKNVLVVQYEDLVLNPEKIVRTICDFLQIEYKQRLIQGVFKSSVNKNDKPIIDPEIETICIEMYNRLQTVKN